jgi:hypothetical protein
VEVVDGCGRSFDPAELALGDAEPVGQLGLLDLGGLRGAVGAQEAAKMSTEQGCPDFRLFPEVGG